ncbi:undecaprenyl-diphosphatase [Litorivivens lipolytica]|uniref:undecaprenyl-diphosphate phosphatase n=1 Tax=Litorivivens lipolytica TaxID=1524264 RepID=A0A7W4W5T8_9GAMM|nr:phosphatase PAP2 family protein [Litorivivens lipolytica]MBB3048023.1 undecaprenyl-diphosphatase [Litorivivens lipolytica]
MQILTTLTQYDTRMFLWCVNSRHQSVLAKTAKQVSRSGDGYLQILIPVGLALIAGEAGQHLLLATLLAFAIELPLYWVLKNSFQRRRPPEAIPSFSSVITASDKFSFPSGHTAAAVMLATLVYLSFGLVALPLMIWAAMVGASRVILGVHFPTDILAGATLGATLAYASFSIVVI